MKTERLNTTKMLDDLEAIELLQKLEENKHSSPNAGLIVDCIEWDHYYTGDEIIEMTRELNDYERPIISNILHMNNKKIHDFNADDPKFNERYYYVLTRQIRDLLNDNARNPQTYVMNEKIRDLGIAFLKKFDEDKAKEARRKKTIISATHQKLQKYNLKIGQEFESRKALAEYCRIDPHQVTKWFKKCWVRES